MVEGSLRSDTILSQIGSRSQAEKIVEIDEKMINFLVFQLGKYLFAFHGSQAREILPFTGITWIPGATALIPGVINVRGDVAAVLDLKQVLSISETGRGVTGGFFVMVREGDGRNGILVDNIVDVVDVPVSANVQLLPTMDERFRRFASSQFEYENKMVTVLDVVWIIEKVNS
ncbi:chemotaxis protein CheW [Sporomusa malonica]|uniref:Purine-binding chemotaxis protein CheW n=1 Tax=Sporomusa malonica TaxID=112901 RepID=A0A1W2CVU6_9FIRM|nr:chemotaxis protein CheW [Sporomusa malonica]SMC89367.1 purine-binding chemotaxis protein CheW [Sporomusa malonica]